MNRILFVAAGLVLCSAPVGAQSIDYIAFQKLFGEPVTASVTGSPQRASDVPASMEIITADDIRRSGAYDIPGVLRHVAGIDVLQWNNDNADVGVRGYDQALSPRLLVLIDGRQVYADFYGYTPWSALPVELGAIRQIEVVKGPNTALFGFNAADGVINIVTKDPLYEAPGELTIGGGTQDLAQGSAIGTHRLGRDAAFRLSAGGRSDADFSTAIPATMAVLPRSHNNRDAFDLEGAARLGHGLQLRIGASHSDVTQNEMSPVYELSYDHYHTNSLRGELTADGRWGLIKASAFTNWITVDDLSRTNGIDVNLHNRVTVLQLQDVFNPTSAHTLRISSEYRYNTESSSPIAGADIFYSVYSVGGMWEWRLAPTLTLTNAVRFDELTLGRSGSTPPGYPLRNADWDRAIWEPSFNSGLVWRATEADTLRLTIGRGVQVPDLVSAGALLLTTPQGNLTGVPSLPTTMITNYETGWDRTVPAIDGRLRASLFLLQTKNINSLEGGLVQGGGTTFATPANVGDSNAFGLELGVKGALPHNWRWSLNYRLEHIHDHFVPFDQNGADLVDFEHTAPAHVVKGSLGWSHGPWEADAFLHYQSRSHGLVGTLAGTSATLEPIAPYAALDGRVGYALGRHVTLSVSGQNLLQSTQKQTSGPSVERRLYGTLTVDFGKSVP